MEATKLLSLEGAILWIIIVMIVAVILILIFMFFDLLVRGVRKIIKCVKWLFISETFTVSGKVVSLINKSYYYSNSLLNDCSNSLCSEIIFENEETFIKIRDYENNKIYKVLLNNNRNPQLRAGEDMIIKIKKIAWEKIYTQA